MANQINTNHSAVLLNSATKSSNKTAGLNGVNGSSEQLSSSKAHENQADRVSVTSEAARLQKIEEQLSAVPAVNSAKVAEIKAAIANGTFTIDPQAIASKLIAFETGQ